MDTFDRVIQKIFGNKKRRKFKFFSEYFNVNDIVGFLSWKQIKKAGYKVASHLVLLIGYPPYEGNRYIIEKAYIVRENIYILLVQDTLINKHFLVKWEKSKSSHADITE